MAVTPVLNLCAVLWYRRTQWSQSSSSIGRSAQASLGISDRGRACNSARAGTGPKEKSWARAIAEPSHRSWISMPWPQATLSIHTNLKMHSFRISVLRY